MTISACLIVKNEKEMLSQCLESLKGIDEIFIADTGSVDNTVEIAKRYTPHVYTEKKWEDDFANCRNFIKDRATTDWILSIDADEILHSVAKLREAVLLAEREGLLAVNCKLLAEDKTLENREQWFDFPRLFKNLPQVQWTGNVHNHLSVEGGQVGDVRITHRYSPAHNLDPDRAFRILKKEVDTRGDSAVREMFYLAREYYYKNDWDTTISLLKRYVELDRFLAQKAEAYLMLAKAYGYKGDMDNSRLYILQAIAINPNFKEAIEHMVWVSGDGLGDEKWQKNADQWKKFAELADNDNVLFVRT